MKKKKKIDDDDDEFVVRMWSGELVLFSFLAWSGALVHIFCLVGVSGGDLPYFGHVTLNFNFSGLFISLNNLPGGLTLNFSGLGASGGNLPCYQLLKNKIFLSLEGQSR